MLELRDSKLAPMAKRRAMAAETWRSIRKDITSGDLAGGGKAPPAQAAAREFEGQRSKVPLPEIQVAAPETISLPRKDITEADRKACSCVEKCACQVEAKAEQPVRKPLPTPADGQKEDEFISSCMSSLNSEYPDEKQRAAICYSQWREKNAEPVEKAIEPYKQPDKPGVMIALHVPSKVAKKLAQKGGMTPEDMHVTLGYYGKLGEHVNDDHVEAMKKCIAKAATGYAPIKAAIGGVGRFNATKSSDDKDVLIGLIDSPDLHSVREHLVEHVSKCSTIAKAEGESTPAGPTPFKNHGYTPHITLGYIDPGDEMPVHKLDRDEFTFTHIVMQVGTDKAHYALGEEQNVTKSIRCPIIKAADDDRLATGIVLQPEVVDAQGDIYSAEVIRKAAHDFLAMYNDKTRLGLQHEVMGPDGVELVESWTSPFEFEMNKRVIKAGTWMMTVRVKNDSLWNLVKVGKLNGFSIGGIARVQRLQ